MKGKIVLVRFPFTDLTATKLRPALVIHANRNDLLPLSSHHVLLRKYPEWS